MSDAPTIPGRVTTPFDAHSCTIGIDGHGYLVADNIVPWCRGLERDTVIQYRINAGNAVDLIRCSRPPARQPTQAAAPYQQVHVPSQEEIRAGTPTPTVVTGPALPKTAAKKVDPAPAAPVQTVAPPLPLVPSMQPQDLREHRIYWTGLLNTATAMVTATLPPDGEARAAFPVATVQEAILEAATRYDQFIRGRAADVLQEKEEQRKQTRPTIETISERMME